MLGLGSSLAKGGASLLTFVKDNLKLYLDFNSNKSDTLKFPSEGSTSFDGNNDYINVGSAIGDMSGKDVSVTAWFNTRNVNTTSQSIISQQDGTGTGRYILAIGIESANGGKLETFLGGVAHTVDIALENNRWYHACYTMNSSTNEYKLYLDGQLGDSGIDPIESSDGDFVIGTNKTVQYFFNGKIANIGLWSRTLTPEEIQSIMNKSYSQLKGVEKTSLVSWWALDSQSDGLVQPATGEELGAEKITSNTTSNWSDFVSNGTEPVKTNTANGVSLRSQGDSRAAYYTISGLTNGSLYKVVFNSRTDIVDGNAKIYFNASSTYFSSGISTTDTQYTIYGIAGSSNSLNIFGLDTGTTIFVENFSVKEVTSNTGVVTGATTTTSVYGGNAPILPRAVDVAKEGQADAIGNGSARFVGSNTDAIVIENGKSPSYPFTLTAWVYPELFNSYGAIYNAWVNDSLWWGIYSHASSGKVRLHLVGGNDFIDTPNGSLPVNEWSHIATTWDGTNAKTYINGIAQTMSLTGALAMPTAEGPPAIGIRSDNLSHNPYTGDIAQLGIFAGALTQAQIQSVFESTSYSKIPADVKSTLGAELALDGGFDTDVSAQGSSDDWSLLGGGTVVHEISDGRYRYTDSGTGILRLKQSGSNKTLTLNKLHKLTFEIFDNTTYMGFFTSAETLITYSTYTVGTHTVYFTPTASHTHFDIKPSSVSASFSMDNVSLKEVTNDIVAYYPLDGSSEVKGLSFDGNDDKITFTRQVFTGAFTISWWFNGDVNTNYKGILVDSTDINSTNIGVEDVNGQVRIYIQGSGRAILNSVPNNEWCHIAFTRDGSGNIKTYLNGVAGGTSTDTNTFALDTIGRNSVMSISSVSMYNVEKSASEVLSIYNDGIGGDESSNSGLVGYWKLDNATTVTDLSGNGNNGTVNGGATLISAGTTDSVGNNDGGLY